MNYWDDRMNGLMGDFMGKPFDLVLGRRTYDIFAAHWPHVTDEFGGRAAEQRGQIRGVAGETRRSPGTSRWRWRGDAAASVAQLKQSDGPELQVHGSGDLLQTLIGADLIDEYRLWTFPLLLGAGKRLFAGRHGAGLPGA